MPHSDLNLAALIGSRICHDLISPIGAINNGLELLSLTGEGSGSPEMSLIADSCDSANARIRFFRIAFGTASASQSVGRAEVINILDATLRDSKLSADWHPKGDLLRGDVQLAFLALQCIETALPRGGAVTFDRTDDCWRVAGTGPIMKADPNLWSDLSIRTDWQGLQPSQVQFALLSVLTNDQSRVVTSQIQDDSITLTF